MNLHFQNHLDPPLFSKQEYLSIQWQLRIDWKLFETYLCRYWNSHWKGCQGNTCLILLKWYLFLTRSVSDFAQLAQSCLTSTSDRTECGMAELLASLLQQKTSHNNTLRRNGWFSFTVPQSSSVWQGSHGRRSCPVILWLQLRNIERWMGVFSHLFPFYEAQGTSPGNGAVHN